MSESSPAGSTRRVLLLVLLRICNWVAVAVDMLYLKVTSYISTCIFISISTLMTYFVVRSETAGHRRCSCLRSILIAFLQVAIVVEVMDCCVCCVKGKTPGHGRRASVVEMGRRQSLVDRLDQLTDQTSVMPQEPADSFNDMMRIKSLQDDTVPGRSGTPQSFAKERRRFVRKLMIFSLPEAAYSTCYTLWKLMDSMSKIKWFDGPRCPDMDAQADPEGEEFNRWFKESDHGIIKRICQDCDSDHKKVYYLRIYHAIEKEKNNVFKPYRYMVSEWKEEALDGGPPNAFQKDFALYSTYADAIEGSTSSRWQDCTKWSTRGDPVGFPGDCGKDNISSGQSSRFTDLPGNCNRTQGQSHFSYHVERSWWGWLVTTIPATIKSLLAGTRSTIVSFWCSVSLFSMMAVAVTALTFCLRDFVVWIWIQTDFVKEHSLIVIMFYFFEICSWLPMLVFFCFYHANIFIEAFMPNLIFICLATIMGFYVKAADLSRIKGNELLSQVLFSACLSPFIFFVNFLYFDRSTTFRHLRKTYYIVRFFFVTICLYRFPSETTHPVVVLAVMASFVLQLMVWSWIPARRIKHERAVMEKACNRMEDIVPSHIIRMDVEDVVRSLHRAQSLERAPTSPMVDGLNAVGDTFEALLLASKTESSRVRQGVLRIAVAPLAQADPVLLRQLLPLILPQLLLALRWRTVAEGDDEYCPLSSFVIDRVLTCGSAELVTIVYWELLVLATDRSAAAFETYRSFRERFLLVLQKKTFDGRSYEEDFCNASLTLLANQARLYSQMRSVARWCSQKAGGSHAQKTEFLRTTCLRPTIRKMWQGRKVLAPRPESDSKVNVNEIIIHYPSSPTVVLEEPSRSQRCCSCIRKCCWACFVYAVRVCLCRACSCCPFYRKMNNEEKDDIVKEEWERDYVLWEYEDVDLDLIEPKNSPLPVDPLDTIIGIDARKSFVAHSAVAPVVFNCRMSGGYDDRRRLFALKNGDDLRQDALILQIFKLMETTWKENGLQECVLKPYSVRPVSPTEGLVAFVSRCEKVSSVIFEYDGDFVKFITKRCTTDKEQGFDLLCGSTAAYCVATFVMGIGDRHLDNLMITEDGRFFHIDFGFVLGSDPKPGAPPVRVPREIVDAIKATNRYDNFKRLVGEAYVLLRYTPRIWSALLGLTREAGGNGVDALKVEDSVSTVLERLHLELDDESAKTFIINEVESCAASPLPMLFDKLHQLGLFWH